jgi:hypothetical protein
MKQLFTCLAGSHLYGLSSPSSDLDYRGIFMPSLRDCVTNNISNTLSNGSIDKVDFSIQHFFSLLNKGEVNCFDILHARHTLISTTPQWEYIYSNRKSFYSKRLTGFIGFVLSQTRKYCDRGARYNEVSKVLHFLKSLDSGSKLGNAWESLPVGDYSHYGKDKNGNDVYIVCERMVHPTITVGYAIHVFDSYKKLYGHRSIYASSDGLGYDLKAISHGLRCLDELEQIIVEGDLTFPLRSRDYLFKVKTGQIPVNDDIFMQMDERVKHLKSLIDKSSLPSSIDFSHWNDWLYSQYSTFIIH